MMTGNISSACYICHSDKGAHKLEKLRRIKTLVEAKTPKGSKRPGGRLSIRIAHVLSIRERCRFGLPCAEAEQTRSTSGVIAREIETLLNSGYDWTNVHEILRLMQGDFPQAYRIFEREYSKRRNKYEQEA